MISYLNVVLVVLLVSSLAFTFLYTSHLLYVVLTSRKRVKTHQEAIVSRISGMIATSTTTSAAVFAVLAIIQYTLWTTIQ